MLPAHLGIKGHTLLRLVSLYFWMVYPLGVWKLPGVRLVEGGGRGQLHSKALGSLLHITETFGAAAFHLSSVFAR